MAYSAIPKSSSYFNTTLWTGDGNSTQNITGTGFNADWIWLKGRSGAGDHQLYDKIRGVQKMIISNGTNAESTNSIGLQTFGSDGFTMGSDMTGSGSTFVSWNWLANGAGSSNTDGSINTTYTSVSTVSGFSISTYTGTGSAATIGHGLGAKPAMIIVKRLTGSAEAWTVYHQNLDATAPQDKYLHLNTTDAVMDSAGMWNDTAPTTSVFSVGSTGVTNGSGGTFVAYCFAEKQGYSKFGSYTGNGNADGAFIYTGFKPAMVLFKQSSASGEKWYIYDNKRNAFNITNSVLFPNTNDAESSATTGAPIDMLSNGFKLKGTDAAGNGSGSTYIYMAFGQPIVSTNGDIATAR